MDSIFYLILLALVTVVICGDPEDFLKGFTLKTAKNHGCYQIYNSTDPVDGSTCRKTHKTEKTSCALALQDDENHCEIRTPSNESIIVPCYEALEKYSTDPNRELYDIHYNKRNKVECYMVRKGQEVQEVCPKLIDKDTAAITTPENYTLILKANACYSGKWLSALLAHRDFVSNFTFDPNERSCYKVFTAEQKISDVTCSDLMESTMACVHEWDENPNCTVLTTPNNETVVVDCDGGTNTGKNCVEVHKDGNSTEVCMEELEESCMGITTPSGLRLLFACRICRFNWKIYSYDKVKLKKQREFVKKLLEKREYYKHKFEVWNNDYRWKFNSKQWVYPYWLPNTTCYGFELDTNETVIIQCTDRKFERKGCFKIIEPNEKEERDICATVFEETCAVIYTPKEKRVFIGCFNDNYERRLKEFRFHPIKNSSCYQIYTSEENVNSSTCRKPHEKSKRSCVTELKGSYDYCEISTPSGETVKVKCTTLTDPPIADSEDLNYSYNRSKNSTIECYEVSKNGSDPKKLCPQVVDALATGVVTPDGYTILLHSDICIPYKSKAEINADRDFMSNFHFDPVERSCYKFYTPDQPISPYTCEDYYHLEFKIRMKIHMSCVETWEENEKCSVVKSQNNETIILDCVGEKNNKANCFSVYKDGNTTEVCMEELSEGCMGITTPSGIRMLFACRICKPYRQTTVKYDKEFLRSRGKFIKTYLKKELKGKNSYYRNSFELLINGDVKKPYFPIWLPGTNCYGLDLESKEKVLFKCTDRDFSKPGCFKVTNSEGKDETDICAFIFEEKCVLIKTPKGYNIILACYDEEKGRAKSFVRNELHNFKHGIYTFHDTGTEIKKYYKTGNDCKQQVEDYQTQWLHEHQCWGTVTPDLETILLECPDKNKTGCFNVYAQKYGSDNQALPSSYETYKTCIETISDFCAGVVTRKGWKIQLSCYSDEEKVE